LIVFCVSATGLRTVTSTSCGVAPFDTVEVDADADAAGAAAAVADAEALGVAVASGTAERRGAAAPALGAAAALAAAGAGLEGLSHPMIRTDDTTDRTDSFMRLRSSRGAHSAWK
jgi:hypothetical protein